MTTRGGRVRGRVGTTVSDNFNRADGGLGAGWAAVGDGGLSISSQAVLGSSATAGDIRVGETYAGDQSSQIEVTSTQLSGGQWIGPAVRMQNGGQSMYLGIYFWNNGTQQLRLYKRSAGTWIQLGSSYNSGPLAAGTQLQLTAVGSTISFLQNGVTRISVADSQRHRRRARDHDLRHREGRQLGGWQRQFAAAADVFGRRLGVGLGGGVVLQDNGADNLSVSANGSFTFATALRLRGRVCGDGEDEPLRADLQRHQRLRHDRRGERDQRGRHLCRHARLLGRRLGLGLGGDVVLQDNGADNLSVSANGSFTFATALPSGAAYAVTVKTNPSGQTCSVTNGSGTIGAANVTNVAVTCAATPAYSVGGSVSGLAGTRGVAGQRRRQPERERERVVHVRDALASGAAYAVTVKTNPSGQTCSVTNGSGTVGAANVTTVVVACSASASGSTRLGRFQSGGRRVGGGLGGCR